MKTRFLFARRLAAIPLFLFLSGCQPKSIEERVASLPELPPAIADTLDPETLATKTVSELRPSDKVPAPVAAGPCCSISETRRLKVMFPYTKCGAPFDFFDLGELVLSQDRPAGAKPPELHRLTTFRGRQLTRVNLCFSSQGPWNAVFKENRACSPFTPVRTLTISAFGDAIPFTWSGFQSPPANVQVVGCRTEGILRGFCPNALSTCECPSAPCTVEASCQCPLQLPSGAS